MSENSENEDSEEPPSIYELYDRFRDEFVSGTDEGGRVINPRGAPMAELFIKFLETRKSSVDEDRDWGWTLEASSLIRIAGEIDDEVDSWEKDEDAPIEDLKIIISDKVVLFFTLANEMLQGLAGELLNEEIVSDSRKSESSLSMARELPQEVKEDLLYYSGLIDSGMKGEMANIRKTRNKLTHDLRNRYYLENIDNIQSRIERTIETLNRVHRLAHDYDLFVDTE